MNEPRMLVTLAAEQQLADFFAGARPHWLCRLFGHRYHETLESYGNVFVFARCERCPWTQWTRTESGI